MENNKKLRKKDKENGRIYTPDFVVKNILDFSGYMGQAILKKHIIDNSCGDGAFLMQVVSRYCEVATKNNISKEELENDLALYIHGIELERIECDKCQKKLNEIISKFGLNNIPWDIKCADALVVTEYDNKMDFVVGNPPYVRVHNLVENRNEVRKFSFTRSGMTDLYIVFFEIGIRMLTASGVLGYITPSSYFNSVAGAYMREKILKDNLLEKVIDFRHFQAFAATTYTAITILRKGKSMSGVEYYRFDEQKRFPQYIETLNYEDFYISNNFYFGNKRDLTFLKSVFYHLTHCDIVVKNGYATLCDDVFINNFSFSSQYVLPVVKASTGTKQTMFYPYDINANLIPESILQENKKLYAYLVENKDRLLNRTNEKDKEKNWYAFGRSQALKDTFKNKIAINVLMRSKEDLKIVDAPAGTGVYSGLYILSETITLDKIKNSLSSDEFIDYVSMLGKYKSGGYYTFSSKDIKAYLDYKFV